ncbi:hypothetical protein A0H76_41 [Hepatospora eriocheir]|uniref:Uncharacterized protein n=1 Tax=Hepatospora eriocheir TaxID=1081669 RepID=A0A1X0QJB3_9MICR|nr:hypothetical protein A0H76_41 [Hepatospora eriocheir]
MILTPSMSERLDENFISDNEEVDQFSILLYEYLDKYQYDSTKVLFEKALNVDFDKHKPKYNKECKYSRLAAWYSNFVETATVRNGSPFYRFVSDRFEFVQLYLEKKKKKLNEKAIKFFNQHTDENDKIIQLDIPFLTEYFTVNLELHFVDEITIDTRYIIAIEDRYLRVLEYPSGKYIFNDYFDQKLTNLVTVVFNDTIFIGVCTDKYTFKVFGLNVNKGFGIVGQMRFDEEIEKVVLIGTSLFVKRQNRIDHYNLDCKVFSYNITEKYITRIYKFNTNLILVDDNTSTMYVYNVKLNCIISSTSFKSLSKLFIKKQNIIILGDTLKIYNLDLNNLIIDKEYTYNYDDVLDIVYLDSKVICLTKNKLIFDEKSIEISDGLCLFPTNLNANKGVFVATKTGKLIFYSH